MLQFAAEYLGWIVAVLGGLGTLVVVVRKGGAKVRHATTKVNQVSDVLLGRPAILHPETGEELVPETPGIGTRMAQMEAWQESAGDILAQLANTQAEMVRTNARVDLIHDALQRHIESCIPGLNQTINVQPHE